MPDPKIAAKAIAALFVLTLLSAVLTITWKDSAAQSQQPGFSACPPAGGWATAVWLGPSDTPVNQALSACPGVSINTVFRWNAQDQAWLYFFADALGDVNTLPALNNGHALFLHGLALAPAGTPTPTPSPAVENWIAREGIVRAGTTSTSSILLPNGKVRTYFLGQDGGIVFAESDDGANLSSITPTNVKGSFTAGDSQSFVSNPAVLRRAGGGYIMVHEASSQLPAPPNFPDRLLYVRTSQDGITFSVPVQLPNSQMDRDPMGKIFQSVPDMVQMTDGAIRLYYVANGTATASMRSPDGAASWQQEESYRLGSSSPGIFYVDPDAVVRPDGSVVLYIAYSEAEPQCGGLGCQRFRLATSSDGLNFILQPTDLLTAPPGKNALVDPDVFQTAQGAWHMLYGEVGQDNQIDLRLATLSMSPSSPAPTPSFSPAPTPTPSGDAITGNFIMAFHACNTAVNDCGTPMNHRTYLAQSSDGSSWTPIPGFQPYPGSVPDVIRRGNTLYLFNPGAVRRFHLDTGQMEGPFQVQFTGGVGDELFVDPSPTMDENGRIVLFYLVGQIGSDPARCGPGVSSCTKVFHSATEAAGSEGTSFTVDPGDRFTITINGMETASDPDIFQGPDGPILYISKGNSVQALSSPTLSGAYANISNLPNGILSNNLGGVPAGHYDAATGKFWTYVHTNDGGNIVIKRAVHGSLSAPLSAGDFSTVIAGASFPELGNSYRVESPGFAVNVP